MAPNLQRIWPRTQFLLIDSTYVPYSFVPTPMKSCVPECRLKLRALLSTPVTASGEWRCRRTGSQLDRCPTGPGNRKVLVATLAGVLDTKKPRAVSTNGSRDKCRGRHPKDKDSGSRARAWGVRRRLRTSIEHLEGSGSSHRQPKNEIDA